MRRFLRCVAVWAAINVAALIGLTLHVARRDVRLATQGDAILFAFLALVEAIVLALGAWAAYRLWRLETAGRTGTLVFFALLACIVLMGGLSTVNVAHAASSLVIIGLLLTPAAGDECA